MEGNEAKQNPDLKPSWVIGFNGGKRASLPACVCSVIVEFCITVRLRLADQAQAFRPGPWAFLGRQSD
jgi:hypothetical protein